MWSLTLKVVTIPIVASVIFSLILLYDLYVFQYRGTLAFGLFETTKLEPRDPGPNSPISLLENYPAIASTGLGKTSSSLYNNIALSKSSGAENGSTTSQTLTQSSSGSNTLEYTSRFICGTITGENGPLRPGRYNSDINIFNRQNFPVSFLWKATLNGDTRDHNYNIQNLGPGKSTSIDCTQILNSIPGLGNASSEKYYEGVLTINVDLDPSILSAISSSKGGVAGVISGSEATSVLSVDAIYTVNALKVSNREI